MRIQIKISCANEVYNKEDTSLLAKAATYSLNFGGGVLVQYHTSIVKLGVAITSVPHLCIVLCKTHFNSLARDARLLSYGTPPILQPTVACHYHRAHHLESCLETS